MYKEISAVNIPVSYKQACYHTMQVILHILRRKCWFKKIFWFQTAEISFLRFNCDSFCACCYRVPHKSTYLISAVSWYMNEENRITQYKVIVKKCDPIPPKSIIAVESRCLSITGRNFSFHHKPIHRSCMAVPMESDKMMICLCLPIHLSFQFEAPINYATVVCCLAVMFHLCNMVRIQNLII